MKSYVIIDVPHNELYEKCKLCSRLRLLEVGFIPGQKVKVEKQRYGMFAVHMISSNGKIEQTFALRPEELDIIYLKELKKNV